MPAPGDEPDDDFEAVVRKKLEERSEILSFEINESSQKHVLVVVVERTDDAETQESLYRIEYEPRPEGGEDIHWRFLGTVD
ncbi:hypothetical protein [Halocatena halophila]|uniref:hypothetical protein n=1 Tax=Halocatena halophila TaxID=2814576 RepID=UPI002ED6B376